MKRTITAATIIIFSSIAAPGALGAAGPTGSEFDGVWRHAPDPKAAELRRASIEAATEDLSAFIRGTARDRLDERTTPPRALKLAVRGDQVEISRDGKSVSLRLDAKPITMERNGQRGALSVRLDGGRIVLESEGERGRRTTTYELSSDGRRLTMSVRMIGDKLRAPIVYRSTYRRE